MTPRPSVRGLDEVVEVERGFAEEFRPALLIELEQSALDGADAGGADIAVFDGELRGVLGDEFQHLAQVFEIEQQQPMIVRDFEEQLEHAFLRVVEIEHAREEQRDPSR